MYFETAPKRKKADLFNFEHEYWQLTDMLKSSDYKLIVVSGLRRTGKTSLIRVVMNENNFDHIWLDGRSFDSRVEFLGQLAQELKNKKLLPVESIELKGVKFSMEESLYEMLKKTKGLMLVVDEAQYLSPLKIDRFFAYLYDNLDIKIILSGSEVGLLNRFIGTEDPKAPLFGRAIGEVKTRRLSKSEGMKFLMDGGRQVGVAIDKTEAEEVVDRLDGIIGWLTLYGWFRKNKHTHEDALKKTLKTGKMMAKEEFHAFLATRKSRKRYSTIMKILKGRELSWSEIKSLMEKKMGYPISDMQISMYLEHLLDYCFIEKKEDKYKITDPLIEMLF